MAEKLSITIFLEGAAEIERQLEGIGEAGTKAFDAIGTAAENVGGFDKLDPKDVTAKLEQFGVKGKAAIDKITAAVAAAGRLERVVGGVRQVETAFAGIGVAASAMSQRVTGAFTAIATAAAGTGGAIGRVGRSLGLIGSGAIIGSLGAAALAMEKAADSARILEGNLQATFRNAEQGTQFFNQIQSSAQDAGASLESTGKVMLGIVQKIQAALAAKGFRFAPGEGFKQATADAQEYFDTLQNGMQLSGARADDATKSIKTLFDEISKNQAKQGEAQELDRLRKLAARLPEFRSELAAFEQDIRQRAQRMADVLRKFGAEFPQLANEIVKSLGTPGQSIEQLADQVEKGIRKIDIKKFGDAIKSAAPDIQKLRDAFDPTLGQRMDAISGAWDRLLNSFGKSPASAGIKAAMDDIAKGLDEIAKKQEQIGKFTVDKPPATVTGGLLEQAFNEFNQNIEIAKQNWKTLKTKLSDPIKLVLDFANLTPFGLALNAALRLIEKLKQASQDKITVPFEADPEPPFVESYLAAIERIKTAFKSIFTPDVAPEGAPEPAFVQSYLTAIEKVKTAFISIFTPTVAPEGAAEPPFVQRYLAAIEKVKAALATIFTPTVAAEGAPEPAFVQQYLVAIQAVKNAIAGITWDSISSAGVTAFNAIVSAVQQAGSAIAQFVSSLASIAWGTISGAGVAAWNAITSAAQTAGSAIQQFVSSLGSIAWGAVGAGVAAWNAVTGAIQSAIAALTQFLGLKGGGGAAAGGSVGGFQGGGLLGGRGTGTSDSNLVRVSRGEYIVPARAVRQPGVLTFLEALRHSGGRLQDIIDDMGRFALGGLVPRAIPAFATGGLVGGGMSNVTIQFPGLPEISGLRAPKAVVDELHRAAALAQVRSGGRKPSRYT